jgi:hypothetical protein
LQTSTSGFTWLLKDIYKVLELKMITKLYNIHNIIVDVVGGDGVGWWQQKRVSLIREL